MVNEEDADLGKVQRLVEHLQRPVCLPAVIVNARERQKKFALPLGVPLGEAPNGVCDGGHGREQVLVGALALESPRSPPVGDARVVDQECVSACAGGDQRG